MTYGLPTPVKQTRLAGLFVSAIDLNRDYPMYEVGVFSDDAEFHDYHMIRFETEEEAVAEHDRCLELIRSVTPGELPFKPRAAIES